jgi:hypothetical protein
VSELQPVLAAFTSLTSLSLVGNALESFLDPILSLKSLRKLRLGGQAEVTLTLSEQKLRDLTALLHLKVLTLSGVGLHALPRDLQRDDFEQLEHLSVENNKLETLSLWISKLAKLGKLNVRDNQLKAFLNLDPSHLLAILDVRGNHLVELPLSLGFVDALEELRVHPQRNYTVLRRPPPELAVAASEGAVAVATRDIKSYLQNLRQGKEVERKMVRLGFLGKGAAGKTTLCLALQSRLASSSPASTVGIDIGTWALKGPGKEDQSVYFRTWDFAGKSFNPGLDARSQ